jgi:hypothetical protein|tara:strand:- start:325 stop:654 length:330 start_codon:yes stop_codon:yes gene_type:complete
MENWLMKNIQYLVTSSGTIVRDGLVKFEFNDLTVGEDMPDTFEDAAHMAYDHCKDDKSIRVLFLNHVDGTLSDATDQVAHFVADNLYTQDEDFIIPEWAQIAFDRLDKN